MTDKPRSYQIPENKADDGDGRDFDVAEGCAGRFSVGKPKGLTPDDRGADCLDEYYKEREDAAKKEQVRFRLAVPEGHPFKRLSRGTLQYESARYDEEAREVVMGGQRYLICEFFGKSAFYNVYQAVDDRDVKVTLKIGLRPNEKSTKDRPPYKVIEGDGIKHPPGSMLVPCSEWLALKVIEEASAKISSAALSKNFDPHVPASTLRSKFFCRLASGTFAEASEDASKDADVEPGFRIPRALSSGRLSDGRVVFAREFIDGEEFYKLICRALEYFKIPQRGFFKEGRIRKRARLIQTMILLMVRDAIASSEFMSDAKIMNYDNKIDAYFTGPALSADKNPSPGDYEKTWSPAFVDWDNYVMPADLGAEINGAVWRNLFFDNVSRLVNNSMEIIGMIYVECISPEYPKVLEEMRNFAAMMGDFCDLLKKGKQQPSEFDFSAFRKSLEDLNMWAEKLGLEMHLKYPF